MLMNTTAMTAEREALSMGPVHIHVLFHWKQKIFQFAVEMRVEKQSTKLIRSPCVSSVSVTIMRRTCIVLMRIVLGKKGNV